MISFLVNLKITHYFCKNLPSRISVDIEEIMLLIHCYFRLCWNVKKNVGLSNSFVILKFSLFFTQFEKEI